MARRARRAALTQSALCALRVRCSTITSTPTTTPTATTTNGLCVTCQCTNKHDNERDSQGAQRPRAHRCRRSSSWARARLQQPPAELDCCQPRSPHDLSPRYGHPCVCEAHSCSQRAQYAPSWRKQTKKLARLRLIVARERRCRASEALPSAARKRSLPVPVGAKLWAGARNCRAAGSQSKQQEPFCVRGAAPRSSWSWS